MMVDAESHRKDDPSGRWKAGNVYDLAVTLIDSKSGSTIAVLFKQCNRYGKLDGRQQARASAAIRPRPDCRKIQLPLSRIRIGRSRGWP